MSQCSTQNRYDQGLIKNAIEVVKSKLSYEPMIPGLKKASNTEDHGPCPFFGCGGTDRFIWNTAGPRQGKGTCRQCGFSGDIIDLYMKINGIDNIIEVIKREAPEMLEQQDFEEFKAFTEQPTKNDKKIEYLWGQCSTKNPDEIRALLCDRRKIDQGTVDLLINTGRVRYRKHGGVDAVAYPYTTLQGKVEALQFATNDEQFFPFTARADNTRPANKVFLGGSKPGNDCFFSAGQPIDKAEGDLFILEGAINAITLVPYHPDACILALGGATYTKKLEALKPYLNRFKKIVSCGDNDPAGEKLNQAIRATLGENVRAFRWAPDDPPKMDVNDLQMTGQGERIPSLVDNSRQIVLSMDRKPDIKPEDQGPEIFWDKESENENPYPVNAYPEIARNAIIEYQTYGQQPLALICCSALATMCLATQGFHDVARDSTLVSPISLNILIIAVSGERKTGADNHFSTPIKAWIEEQKEIIKPQIINRIAERSAWKSKLSGINDAIKAGAKKGSDTTELEKKLIDLQRAEPKRIIEPNCLYGDANPASLGEALSHGFPVGASWTSEAGVFVGGDGMQQKTAMLYLAMLNQLWDCGQYKNQRKTVDSINIKGRRFSACLMMQHSVFDELNKGGLSRDMGALARFLIASPKSTIGGRLYTTPPAWFYMDLFYNRIYALLNSELPMNDKGELEPPTLKLSPEAREKWIEFYNETEQQLQPHRTFCDVKDFTSKIADNAARIAGVFHAFQGNDGAISGETMNNANMVALWHLDEAMRVFGEIVLTPEEKDAKLLLSWLMTSDVSLSKGFDKTPFNKGELLRYGPGSLRRKKMRDNALKVLIDCGWIMEKPGNILSLHGKSKEIWNGIS